MPDTFESFADECGLRLTVEPVSAAPRDVLAPLEQREQHFLVELSRPGVRADPVRLVFAKPLGELAGPATRDVLWWLAGDSWIVERSDDTIELWGAAYGYPPTAPATRLLFDQHVRQRDALLRLLGELHYRRLLALYEAEMAPRSRR